MKIAIVVTLATAVAGALALWLRRDRRIEPPAGAPAPPVGSEGAELARRFFLNATGASDHPELRDAAIRSALLGLSASVTEIGIFESHGVQLGLETSDTTRSSLESDARHAATIAAALAAARATAATP